MTRADPHANWHEPAQRLSTLFHDPRGKTEAAQGRHDSPRNGLGCGPASFLDSLQAERTSLQAERTALQAERTALQAEETALQAEETALQAEETALQAEGTALQAKEAALQAEETALQAEGTAMQAERTALQAEETALRNSAAPYWAGTPLVQKNCQQKPATRPAIGRSE